MIFYLGCWSISKIYNINIAILDKRLKKNTVGYKLYKSKNYNSNYFVLLYRSIINDNNIFNIVQNKNKILFKINELPAKFIEHITINEK